VARHGLPDEERDWSLDGVRKTRRAAANDDAPEVRITTCPKCFTVHLPAPSCPTCHHVYPAAERKVEQTDGDLVEIGAEQMEAIRRQKRLAQGNAKTVEELVAQGIGRFRAMKIVQAREEKTRLREELIPRRTELGLSLRDVMMMKPKELRDAVARLSSGAVAA
jgi:hypothetical protein